jgi:hypothetical protein
MMVNSAQPGEGGMCIVQVLPLPVYIYIIMSKVVVYTSAKRADTLLCFSSTLFSSVVKA